MTDIFERASAIINDLAAHPNAEREMEKLEAEASSEEKVMFPALWEALALASNDAPAA